MNMYRREKTSMDVKKCLELLQEQNKHLQNVVNKNKHGAHYDAILEKYKELEKILSSTATESSEDLDEKMKEEYGNVDKISDPSKQDVELFLLMIKEKYAPYQNIPDAPGRSDEEIHELGKKYFSWLPNDTSYAVAMSVYSWTSPDFTRIGYFNLFKYSGLNFGGPIDSNKFDIDTIVEAIWSSNWGTFTPHNYIYMNSFMMKPAATKEDISNQLTNEKLVKLNKHNISQSNLISYALLTMPKTSIKLKDKLYSGQVDISNLGSSKFATYFNQLPANNDLKMAPLDMKLKNALSGFLKVGNIVVYKSFMSFTDSQEDATKYSNGIIVTMLPPDKNDGYWQQCRYITPLSDDPKKIEYLFNIGTKVKVISIDGTLPNVQITFQVINE